MVVKAKLVPRASSSGRRKLPVHPQPSESSSSADMGPCGSGACPPPGVDERRRGRRALARSAAGQE